MVGEEVLGLVREAIREELGLLVDGDAFGLPVVGTADQDKNSLHPLYDLSASHPSRCISCMIASDSLHPLHYLHTYRCISCMV